MKTEVLLCLIAMIVTFRLEDTIRSAVLCATLCAMWRHGVACDV